jgi:tetratricopeptide (TPR) repeat protein
LLDSAIALDPNYAEAYARKSIVLTVLANNYANGADELARDKAESLRLAQNALRIAPDLARGHVALAGVYSSNLQIAAAFAELKRARQLAPSDVRVLTRYSDFAGRMGDTDEALRLADQAIALDPLNREAYGTRIGALYDARRYADAVNYAKQLQSTSPQLFNRAMTVADSLLLLGRPQEAQSYYDQMAPDYWWRLTGETLLLIRAGDGAGAQAKLEKLRQANGEAASYQYGEIYAELGDKDRAFAALDQAFAIKDAGLTALRVDPFLDPLRSDPRFAVLLRKMDFPS